MKTPRNLHEYLEKEKKERIALTKLKEQIEMYENIKRLETLVIALDMIQEVVTEVATPKKKNPFQ